ncbi:MAG: glycosyltransferase [Myxococcales bacterium]|nr:glycosyltransferase [Myxococcales bacterium]
MQNKLPRIMVLSQSPVERDARVLRQISALQTVGSVFVLGYGGRPSLLRPQDTFVSITWKGIGLLGKARNAVLLGAGRLLVSHPIDEHYYWGFAHHRQMWKAAREHSVDLVVANDWDTLPIAARLRQVTGCRMILDLHEHAPLQYDHLALWRWLNGPAVARALHHYMPSVDAAFAVSPIIADELTRQFGRPFDVQRNLPCTSTLPDFHPTDGSRIRLVHHGGATRARALERMIHAVAEAGERFELHFLLVGDTDYVHELKVLSRRLAPGRCHFHTPVAPGKIVERIAEFDLGLFLLPPTNTNYRLALPNKFFEFVTAGLGTCTGPSPEMAELARAHGFGLVSTDFGPSSMATLLRSLDGQQIDGLKRRSIEARRELNAASEMNKLVDVARVLSSSPRGEE